MSIIAESRLLVTWPDGHVERGAIMVAQPQASEGFWTCTITLSGFPSAFGPIAGEDSLQALSLALVMLRRELTLFVERGGRLHDLEGGDWDMRAYLPTI